ncbi:MAG: contractile injection system protein, VgrG/Pvc8 family [Flavobacterium sp.]
MAHFADQVKITIDDYPQNIVYYDLKLTQKMMDHHHFSFTWQYTGSPVIKPADQAAALRKYQGCEVIFTFTTASGNRLMSKGIISKLKSVDVDGSPLGLHVTGISHTILLDDLKKSRSFSDRNLKDIATSIFSGETAGEFYQIDSIKPTFTKIFEHKTQYNETSFEFLKRLSARYGQWLYFDGMRMQLGQTKFSNIKLINRSSLHNFCIETNLVSQKSSLAGYDHMSAAGIKSSKEKTNKGSADSFSRIVLDRQASVSQRNLSVSGYTNQAKNAYEMAEMVELQTAGKDANSVFYSGVSYLPIGVGQVLPSKTKPYNMNLLPLKLFITQSCGAIILVSSRRFLLMLPHRITPMSKPLKKPKASLQE